MQTFVNIMQSQFAASLGKFLRKHALVHRRVRFPLASVLGRNWTGSGSGETSMSLSVYLVIIPLSIYFASFVFSLNIIYFRQRAMISAGNFRDFVISLILWKKNIYLFRNNV